MDPFSADIVARTHRQDLTDQAAESRVARSSRDCAEEQRPAPRPKRPAARARRVAWLG